MNMIPGRRNNKE